MSFSLRTTRQATLPCKRLHEVSGAEERNSCLSTATLYSLLSCGGFVHWMSVVR
jgi:hypothetical protein